MGQTSSRNDVYNLYQGDPTRLHLTELVITPVPSLGTTPTNKGDLSNGAPSPWLTITAPPPSTGDGQDSRPELTFTKPTCDSTGNYFPRDERIQFVCDPEATTASRNTVFLRVPKAEDEELLFKFRFEMVDPGSAEALKDLSFVYAASPRALERTLKEDRVKDSNLSNHPNVVIVNTRPASPLPSDTPPPSSSSSSLVPVTWTWTYRPPPTSPFNSTFTPGARTMGASQFCSFVSYDPTLDTFNVLTAFSIWVDRLPSKYDDTVPTTPELIASLSPSPGPSSAMEPAPLGSPGLRKSFPPFLGPLLSPKNATFLRGRKESGPQPVSPILGGGHLSGVSTDGDDVDDSSPISSHFRVPSSSQDPNILSEQPPAPIPVAGPSSLGGRPAPLLSDPISSGQDFEDGPLFRATLASLEKRAASLRRSVKGLLKAYEASLTSWQALDESDSKITDALSELGETNATACRSIGSAYLDEANRRLSIMRRQIISGLDDGAIGPLRKVASLLKFAESKKKVFEAESKTYYDHVSKYLSLRDNPSNDDPSSSKSKSKSQEAAKADEKYATKRDRFTISRVDYYNSLQELSVFKEAEVLSILTRVAHTQHDVYLGVAQDLDKMGRGVLEDLERQVTELMGDIGVQKLDIETQRRALETRMAMNRQEIVKLVSPPQPQPPQPPPITRSSSETGTVSSSASLPPVETPQRPNNREGRPKSMPPVTPSNPTSVQQEFSENLKKMVKTSLHGLSFPSPKPQSIDPSREILASPTSPSFPDAKRAKASKMSTSLSTPTLPSGDMLTSSDGLLQAKLKGIRDLEFVSADRETNQIRKKEGFLWAATRPTAHQTSADGVRNWHKFWTVLAGGQLAEYTGWKEGLEVHGTPINLRFATVRESRNVERRFCFEVITPQTRRVYQATSDEEVKSWIRAIANSIESLLNGTSSVRHFDSSRLRENSLGSNLTLSETRSDSQSSSQSIGGILSGWNNALIRKNSSHKKRESVSANLKEVARAAARNAKKSVGQVTSLSEGSKSTPSLFALETAETSRVAEEPARNSQSSYTTASETPTRSKGQSSGSDGSSMDDMDKGIADAVHYMAGPLRPIDLPSAADKAKNAAEILRLSLLPGNDSCADCLRPGPKWASWNLGIFICIRCSGIHRSLGSHISKVRSVDLDDWSDEQLAYMTCIGNLVARGYWESLKPNNIQPVDETIADFIKTKYVGKRWAPSEQTPPGLDDSLAAISSVRRSRLSTNPGLMPTISEASSPTNTVSRS